ncbi:response regulator [Duganella sp. FT80W]|uniref:Response regulator n=1 Tax=Duganella guangzhouensis TaxID=2666084 RepID=A0A6I2KV09_9BURK|nr:response regulator transcription factor [Duganella guangzhouensis]MRW89865.1 response regulator [Duganella guangzhouensis]
MTTTPILLVEDDPEIRAPLADFLEGKGYRVHQAASAEAALQLLTQHSVELALLDVMLPGMDGLELCRRLRASDGPRIIMLTALAEATDKVIGLELGADDYVAKPFDLRELLARIRAALRRPASAAPESATAAAAATAAASAAGRDAPAELSMQFSGYTFFPYRRFVRSPSGVRIPLTGAETDLLLVFCQHARQILSREALIGLTRGKNFPIAARSVDLVVSRLRRKLAGERANEDTIRTIRADGYAFQPDVVFN